GGCEAQVPALHAHHQLSRSAAGGHRGGGRVWLRQEGVVHGPDACSAGDISGGKNRRTEEPKNQIGARRFLQFFAASVLWFSYFRRAMITNVMVAAARPIAAPINRCV